MLQGGQTDRQKTGKETMGEVGIKRGESESGITDHESATATATGIETETATSATRIDAGAGSASARSESRDARYYDTIQS